MAYAASDRRGKVVEKWKSRVRACWVEGENLKWRTFDIYLGTAFYNKLLFQLRKELLRGFPEG